MMQNARQTYPDRIVCRAHSLFWGNLYCGRISAPVMGQPTRMNHIANCA